MVFQKKANKGGRQNQKAQGKKPVKLVEDIDMLDDDFEGMDSDDSASDEVQKTPANKTPKGRQSLSERKVSFQMPGKNTPGKTPSKDNSALKKQLTPGKGGLKAFAGMKNNQKNSKQSIDEDDDDDDEDDSDFEAGDLDLDLEDDDDLDEGMDEASDDDDDDDDEDDDDDDDEEDDGDEEEETQNNVQKNAKTQNQKQSPVKTEKQKKLATPKAAQQTPKSAQTPKAAQQTPKSAQTPKVAQTPKAAQTPKSVKKEMNSDSPKSKVPLDEEERRRQRNLSQLYVGNIPKETTAEQLKALSPDIKGCVMPRNERTKSLYAFLQFDSEEIAEKNFELLKSKKFKGQTLNVDYVGQKSLNKKPEENKKSDFTYNLKKLYISGLPVDCTIHQVAKFFPTSNQISFNQSPTFRSATVNFLTEKDGTEAFEATKDIEINGLRVSVLHSLQAGKKLGKRKMNKKSMNNKNHAAKKMKFEPKQEASSDDE